jgi:hypothetical protein
LRNIESDRGSKYSPTDLEPADRTDQLDDAVDLAFASL